MVRIFLCENLLAFSITALSHKVNLRLAMEQSIVYGTEAAYMVPCHQHQEKMRVMGLMGRDLEEVKLAVTRLIRCNTGIVCVVQCNAWLGFPHSPLKATRREKSFLFCPPPSLFNGRG
jgi:hypothetical protein